MYDKKDIYDKISKATSNDGVISKMKQAKHAAISKKIKEELTTQELEEEKRYFIIIHVVQKTSILFIGVFSL